MWQYHCCICLAARQPLTATATTTDSKATGIQQSPERAERTLNIQMTSHSFKHIYENTQLLEAAAASITQSTLDRLQLQVFHQQMPTKDCDVKSWSWFCVLSSWPWSCTLRSRLTMLRLVAACDME